MCAKPGRPAALGQSGAAGRRADALREGGGSHGRLERALDTRVPGRPWQQVGVPPLATAVGQGVCVVHLAPVPCAWHCHLPAVQGQTGVVGQVGELALAVHIPPYRTIAAGDAFCKAGAGLGRAAGHSWHTAGFASALAVPIRQALP